MIEEKINPLINSEQSLTEIKSLVLYNDEINTFDHVIIALVEVCYHDLEQAEQCALITHYKGSCPVKSGPINDLKQLINELHKRNLKAGIE